MKTICKVIVVLLSIFLPMVAVQAQVQKRHEVSLSFGAGFSTLYNDLPNFRYNQKIGQTGGLHYTYFINENFGISSGAEIGYYQSEVKIPSLIGEYSSNNGNEDFIFHFQGENYREIQEATYLNIPLMFQYQTNGTHKFFISAGGKIGIPIGLLDKNYDSNFRSLNTSGYFQNRTVVIDDSKSEGFGSYPSLRTTGKITFENTFIGSVESGMKWRVADNMSVYTGIYVDYGFNDIFRDRNRTEKFVEYNAQNPSQIKINSVINSLYLHMNEEIPFQKKVYLVAYGLKLRFSFDLGDVIGVSPSRPKKKAKSQINNNSPIKVIRYEWPTE